MRFFVVCFVAFAIAHRTGIWCDNAKSPSVKEFLETVDMDKFFCKMNAHLSAIQNETCFRTNFLNVLEKAGVFVDTDLPEHFNDTTTLMVAATDNIVYIFKILTTEKCAMEKAIEFFNKRPPFYGYRYKKREAVCVGLKYEAASRTIVAWRAARFSSEGKETKRMEPKAGASGSSCSI